MQYTDWSIIILAAGKGTRLKSPIPKPLQKIGEQFLIEPIITHALELDCKEVVVVISQFTQEITTHFPDPRLTYLMTEPKGTGAAVQDALERVTTSNVLITQADDSFFYRLPTLESLIQHHTNLITVGVATIHENLPYSFVSYSADRYIVKLNQTSADKAAPPPKDVVCGLYAGNAQWLRKTLPQIQPDSSGEIPFPDIINFALAHTIPVGSFAVPEGEWQGVNTPEELALAKARLQVD